MEMAQEVTKYALHARELHFSPIEALLGNRVRRWSIWHMSLCNELQGTPIPHMVFSFEGFRTVAKLHKFSKERGLVMDTDMFSDRITFATVTLLETSWEYLPFASHVNPPDQGPLKIDSASFKYFVNPKRLLNLEDTRQGPMYVALAIEPNGHMKVYYSYRCHSQQCDGSCGNSLNGPGACKLRFYQYQTAVVQAFVPNGFKFHPDWREYAYQDACTSEHG